MGSWGHRNFENDTAADFAADFRDQPNEALLLAALATAAEEEEYIEADVASEALAAAEIVAAILGKPSPAFPADLQPALKQLDAGDSDDLRELAQEAVEAVLRQSELRELWEETADAAAWKQEQQGLLDRLEEQE
ncbi:DUF4259 domain-containing protein [Hymenobacter lutimineralis]|uniref:DUF4259 domain-containing protein n=1 Tax=Hymenobacter lutimineralis TaxID=2606448 RepID=A0A5D6V0Q1_9BACT|nr:MULTISPECIES: DUF4259 domain-containing protein [Hymenobacter]QIX59807.1 DUF4259 domain-containing protein [Hymenobacter sp. BT18]TYZ08369.1 DUF4259 domain-containing protein [Hymenobacter lutimineralis]